MSKSVDIPGAVTVIAALVGAALLGVVGALLAIPTAAAILMLTARCSSAAGRAKALARGADSACARRLAQLDHDHTGQDQRPPSELDRPGQLVEQQPGPEHPGRPRQRHEGRQPRAEPAYGRDAGT